jgi:hypothetical protein
MVSLFKRMGYFTRVKQEDQYYPDEIRLGAARWQGS